MTVQLNNVVNSTTGERLYNVNMAATILTAAVPLARLFPLRTLVRARYRRRRRSRGDHAAAHPACPHLRRVRDLAIRYGALAVLDRLQLDVGRGEFIVLLGPSGCGKSTLLNAIAGLIDISDGEIWISGKNVTWAEPKDRGIGMVFQSYALYPRMTVEQNLSFGLRMAGLPKAEIAARVDRGRQAAAARAAARAAGPPSSPAASASASPSAGRWSATSTSSCSTSPCPTSTPSCATNCGSRSRSSTRSSATP